MPIYPGAEVTHVHRPKGTMREILFEVKNAPPLGQMVSFYKDELTKNNFKITSSLTIAARKTWTCDFQKDGRPGNVALYPADHDKTATTIDLIYSMPSTVDASMLEPKEDFDVIGPGEPGGSAENVTPVAQNISEDKSKPNKNAKRN